MVSSIPSCPFVMLFCSRPFVSSSLWLINKFRYSFSAKYEVHNEHIQHIQHWPEYILYFALTVGISCRALKEEKYAARRAILPVLQAEEDER